jgi:DNA-binding transcriptional MocR family regulator
MYVFGHGKATVTRDRPTAGWLRHVRRDRYDRSIWRWSTPWKRLFARVSCKPGDQLPPQRAVADQLGHRLHHGHPRLWGGPRPGLIEGAVGRGTFVRRRAPDDEAGLVDLSMNLPPPPRGVSLAALLKETTAAILDRTDVATLMAYHARHRHARPEGGRRGLAGNPPGRGRARKRIVVCPGAQSALTAVADHDRPPRRPPSSSSPSPIRA